MIFVTVGTQLPFDRLIRAVEEWALRRGRSDVYAQIGPASAYRPKGIKWAGFLSAGECRQRIEQADLIVSHAGMGTIISALELGKRLIVMPRRNDLHEHRNNHQVATVTRLIGRTTIAVATDDESLDRHLDALTAVSVLPPISKNAPPELLNAIRYFVNSDMPRVATAEDAMLPE